MATVLASKADGRTPSPRGGSTADLTGRDRLVWNVAASWAGHLVFIVAGFIMPRQIDQHVGQMGLGVWDFGWTAVNYFFLAQIGVGVSVNRYVAQHRAVGDVEGLERTISAAMALQLAAAGVVLVLTAASAIWLPLLFRERLGDELTAARSVIALLGLSTVIRMAFQVFNGVVTGCHRWDLHNLLNSGAYALTVVAMLVTLSLGGGLAAISGVYLVGALVNEVARLGLAYWVCPELRISLRRVRWADARPLVAFGAKLTSIDTVKIIVGQLTGMLVLGQIGVGTLAVYSRLLALIRQTETITYKFSLPLTPTASSLQGSGHGVAVQKLFTDSTRIAACLVWPILIGFAISGDAILDLWMGPRYAQSGLLAFMAIASMFPLSQQPLEMILVGLNLHGRFAAFTIVGSILGLIGSIVAVHWWHWELLGIAGVGLVVLNVEALWIVVNTCRRLAIPLREYFVGSYGEAILCCLPFAAGLALVRFAVPDNSFARLGVSLIVGPCILGPLYWRRLLPGEVRERVLKTAKGRVAALRLTLQAGTQP
jgi:O-antigen/teichoic acid export membrane protein